MTAIQLWLPEFFGGIARPELRRDKQRMFRARTREQMMWAVPGWRGPRNWTQDGIGVSCVNGETLECVRILHIGSNGAVFGPGAGAFPNLSVGGLLDAWLNNEFVTATQKRLGVPLRVKIPDVVPGGVRLVLAEVTPLVQHYFPFAKADGDQVASAQWPPRADLPSTVSPEMESVSPVPPENSLHLRYSWSSPVDELQPLLISPTILSRPTACG
jgi:hypothetical protein